MTDNELLTLLTEQMTDQAVLLERANFLLQGVAYALGWLAGAFCWRLTQYSFRCREFL